MQFNKQLTNSLLIGTQSSTRRRLFKESGLSFKYISPNIAEEEILSNKQIPQSKEALFLLQYILKIKQYLNPQRKKSVWGFC